MKKSIFLLAVVVAIMISTTKVHASIDDCASVVGGGSTEISYITNTAETIDTDSVCNTCADASTYVLKVPTSYGKHFDGWYAEEGFVHKIENYSDLTDDYAYESECVEGKPVIRYKLYAKWSEPVDCPEGGLIKRVVKFDSKGGSSIKDKTVTTAPSVTTFSDKDAAFETPTREGYKFLGWYTSLKYDKKIDNLNDENIPFEAKYTIDGCLDGYYVTLYANWKKLDELEVEDTGLSTNKLFSCIALLIIISGAGIIYATINDKRKDQNIEF